MSSCKVCVDAGVCKMKTIITAKDNGMGMVDVTLESDCPNILRLSWVLTEPLSPYGEVEAEFSESTVYKLCEGRIPHTACPVPSAIIKAIEVAGELGLKRDVSITFLEGERAFRTEPIITIY